MFRTVSAHDHFEQQYVQPNSLPTFRAHIAEWEAFSADVCFAGHSFDVEVYGAHPRCWNSPAMTRSATQFWRGFRREMNRAGKRFERKGCFFRKKTTYCRYPVI